MIKELIEYPGYFISDEGKVFCNLGKGNRRIGKTVELYELTPRKTKSGYMRVMCRNINNKRKDLYIHRLVAENFIDNPENKPCVNHKNCHRDDNRAENLEWVTYKENTKQTEILKHIIRDNSGKYVSNFDYSLYSLLP